MDWRSIADDREKYAAYLCSREWGEKKEAVRARARGKCERCELLTMDACHHLTYARKYAEELEDLQAICSPCHEFTHGKNDFDPKAYHGLLWYLQDCKRASKLAAPVELLNRKATAVDFRDGISEALWVIGVLARETDKMMDLAELLPSYAVREYIDFAARVAGVSGKIADMYGIPFLDTTHLVFDTTYRFDEKAYRRAAEVIGVEIADFAELALHPPSESNGKVA